MNPDRAYRESEGVGCVAGPMPSYTNAGDRMWSDYEISFLKRVYVSPRFTAAEVAEMLGRTANAVMLKASRLGVTKQWEMNIWE